MRWALAGLSDGFKEALSQQTSATHRICQEYARMSNITRPLKSWPLLGRRFSSHPHADDQNLVKRRRSHRRFWTRTCFSSHVEPHFKCEIHQARAGRAVSPPKSRSQPLATEGSGKVVARPKSRRHGGLGASHAAALATVVFLLQRPLHLPVAHAQVAVELRTGALVCPAAPILPRLRPVLATLRSSALAAGGRCPNWRSLRRSRRVPTSWLADSPSSPCPKSSCLGGDMAKRRNTKLAWPETKAPAIPQSHHCLRRFERASRHTPGVNRRDRRPASCARSTSASLQSSNPSAPASRP